ncbi:hypothetical protein ASD24_23135 [Paenibacillus sp. Root52]|uniref:pyocin knob domain-containing protein n=1 Tax=Paenibacillus sp. Root52 TaxID=1736552 RepID=UPI0006F27A8E|nr:pyocin knob domain-containing protein [Paenibacillus sp. Root52]KQY91631.1 hypothetical protein ASD24_23135 [Paenibacillus sp. Root52]
MPKETDRLKLPLPLGNESVTRESINGIFEKIDAGVATREDLDTLHEAVSEDRLAAQKYVDDKSWQRHKLTQDTGVCINVSNGNANNLVLNGDYVGQNVANAPIAAVGISWWYFRVTAYANVWVKQEAINMFTNTYLQRTGSDAGGGVISWGAWSKDVFAEISDLLSENLWGVL